MHGQTNAPVDLEVYTRKKLEESLSGYERPRYRVVIPNAEMAGLVHAAVGDQRSPSRGPTPQNATPAQDATFLTNMIDFTPDEEASQEDNHVIPRAPNRRKTRKKTHM